MQILRVIDSLQLTANHSVATPVNWKHGEDVVVVPGLTDDQANTKVGALRCRRFHLIYPPAYAHVALSSFIHSTHGPPSVQHKVAFRMQHEMMLPQLRACRC